MQLNKLGDTNLSITEIGFGGYRIHDEEIDHVKALEEALLGGINLIDTSSNYTDGHSEKLIGKTIQGLSDKVDRESLVIVSKAGYIQGKTLELYQGKVNEETDIDITKYSDDLWYSIDPLFLKEQLDMSLNRLKLEKLDVYLLHNPEYYLLFSEKDGVPQQEAQQNYYQKIEAAFEYLETEVEAGRIQYYGLSSNTMGYAKEHYHFTNVERILTTRKQKKETHHFKVIQSPLNLFEQDLLEKKSLSNNKNVIDYAHENGLGLLVNRPLNAIKEKKLTRLVDFSEGTAYSDEEIDDCLTSLLDTEEKLKLTVLENILNDESEQKNMGIVFSLAHHLKACVFKEIGIEIWLDMMNYQFIPRLEAGIAHLSQHEHFESRHQQWFEDYFKLVRDIFEKLTGLFLYQKEQLNHHLKQSLIKQLPDLNTALPLQELNIRLLRSVKGVNSILIGMRHSDYVHTFLRDLNIKIVKDRTSLPKL